ncbi:MAG TPA: phage baseplate assembly protein V [Ktedonobacteraceae bacterium]|nr:phage baseplate assembly protein V [Ktedonobacteraceae bacterium]
MNNSEKYYGKYRGIVINNIDPENKGRIMVQVADLTQLTPSTWAEACVPIAGGETPAGVYVVPAIGSNVWVEFEQGDLRYPIWTGCFWGSQTDVPSLALEGLPGSPSIILQTTGQNMIVISDLPGPTGGIMLTNNTGAMILINDVGITISNGQGASIQLVGPTIMLNEDAMTIV